MPAVDVAANLARIRKRIEAAAHRAGREDAEWIRILAVTKDHGPEVIPGLLKSGLRDFGENRIEHLQHMIGHADGASFHYIGRVQSRQFSKLVPICRSLHSLADPDHIERLEATCERAGHRLEVFIQVNPGDDPKKAGAPTKLLPAMVKSVRAAEHLDLQGLMCMAPLGADDERVRECFATCRLWADEHELARCSMGMSADYEIAVEEGATDLRIGSALYSDR